MYKTDRDMQNYMVRVRLSREISTDLQVQIMGFLFVLAWFCLFWLFGFFIVQFTNMCFSNRVQELPIIFQKDYASNMLAT